MLVIQKHFREKLACTYFVTVRTRQRPNRLPLKTHNLRIHNATLQRAERVLLTDELRNEHIRQAELQRTAGKDAGDYHGYEKEAIAEKEIQV